MLRVKPRPLTHRSVKLQAQNSQLKYGSSGVKQDTKRWLFRSLLGGAIIAAGFGYNREQNIAYAKDSMIEQVLEDPNWPEKFPLSPTDFQRYDEDPDFDFYSQPRFVKHIDDGAIGALTKYYGEVFPKDKPDLALLDICSSWISHYPEGIKAQKISGMGMNEAELKKNPILTDYYVKDLNVDPTLPYEDNSFDFVTNAVSVDYLIKPIEVFQEIHRVLKPGGSAIMSFSNRYFPTKAIAIWQATQDLDHIWLTGSYFHFSVPDGFTPPKGIDITPPAKGIAMFGGQDPMYVVTAQKA